VGKSSVTRKGTRPLTLIERRANEVARNTIRTGWSTEMGASEETVKIAIYNALGTDTIPARPTLEPSLRGMLPTIRAENVAIARIVARGKDPVPLLDRLASRMRDHLRSEVLDLSDPPNAESTIDQKGFDDPLVGAGADGGRLVRELDSRRIRK
jgi:hypothetical protein